MADRELTGHDFRATYLVDLHGFLVGCRRAEGAGIRFDCRNSYLFVNWRIDILRMIVKPIFFQRGRAARTRRFAVSTSVLKLLIGES